MPPSTRTAVLIGVLLTLSTAVQAWMIVQARVGAIDTVNFVAHAQWLERDGILAGLRADAAPPLYPLAILTTQRTFEALGLQPSWALSAQLAAAIPLVLCVVPVYLLVRPLFDNATALTAAWLFTVATPLARLGAEGLSDSLHLLGFCTALACWGQAVETIGNRRGLLLVAGGIAIGVTLLARAEVWILLPALMLTPLVSTGGWTTRLRRSAELTGPAFAGIALVAVAWLAPLGVESVEALGTRLLARHGFVDEVPLNLPLDNRSTVFADSSSWQLASGETMQFGRKDPTISIRFHGFAAAVARFSTELLQSWQYLLGIVAVLGIGVAREGWFSPRVWFQRWVFLLYTMAVLGFATWQGYLERRHLLPLVVLTLPWSARGVVWCGEQLAQRRGVARHWGAFGGASVTALLLGSTTWLPIYPGRAAHREAAAWLVAQGGSGAVLDTIGHTALYTGRKTFRHEIAPAALVDPELQFVVIEQAELGYNSRRATTLQELLARYGTLAVTLKPPPQRTGPVVQIYRWSHDRFARQQGLSYAR